jgi:fatty acid desaturase
MLHHAHTNTDDDPDIVVKGTLGHLFVTWLTTYVVLATIPLFLFRFIAPREYRIATTPLRGTESLQASAVAVATIALLCAALAYGRALDWLCLLFIPTRLAALLLNIFFQWLPHHPFDRCERYLNTRISLWPAGTVFTLQQNLHLVHHLWPSVPFYNYGELYKRLRPILIAKGSRIEGLMVGRSVRDRSNCDATHAQWQKRE